MKRTKLCGEQIKREDNCIGGPSKKQKILFINCEIDELYNKSTVVLDNYGSDTNTEFSHSSFSDSENVTATEINECASNTLLWNANGDFIPNIYHFDSTESGINPNINIDDNSDPYDYFRHFLNEEIIDFLVTQTNNFHAYTIENKEISIMSKVRRWQDISSDDLLTFFALTLLMPHVRKVKRAQYWTTDSFIETPIFRRYMSENKYNNINRFLHFHDAKEPNVEDSLYRVSNIIQKFREQFQLCFLPYKKLVLQNSPIYFKERNDKFEAKVFVLCDCITGIILDFFVHTETDMEKFSEDPLGVSGAIVKLLMKPYLDKGHILYTTNWCSSPNLSLYLHNKKTGSCGMVKKNINNIPSFSDSKSEKLQYFVSKPLLVLKYKDRKDIYLLSTIHTTNMIKTSKTDYRSGAVLRKPDALIDYDKNMQVIDKCDIKIGSEEYNRCSVKWYKKFFFHLIDMSMLNAYNLYKERRNKKMNMADFSLIVIKLLLEKHGSLSQIVPIRTNDMPAERLAAANFISRHHLTEIGRNNSGNIMQRHCALCYKSRKNTKAMKKVTSMCAKCKVPLCQECFVVYHTCEF